MTQKDEFPKIWHKKSCHQLYSLNMPALITSSFRFSWRIASITPPKPPGALVKIHNNIVTSIDRGHVGALALLDLSSAVDSQRLMIDRENDTVDQQLLLQILHYRFCVTDSALA